MFKHMLRSLCVCAVRVHLFVRWIVSRGLCGVFRSSVPGPVKQIAGSSKTVCRYALNPISEVKWMEKLDFSRITRMPPQFAKAFERGVSFRWKAGNIGTARKKMIAYLFYWEI